MSLQHELAGAEPLPFPAHAASRARLGKLFLSRLRRLLVIRREQSGRLNGGGIRLLDRTIYSTYCDCLESGVEEEARELLQTRPQT